MCIVHCLLPHVSNIKCLNLVVHVLQVMFDAEFRCYFDPECLEFEVLEFNTDHKYAYCVTRQGFHMPFPFFAREMVLSTTIVQENNRYIVYRKPFPGRHPNSGYVSMIAASVMILDVIDDNSCSFVGGNYVDFSGYIPTSIFSQKIKEKATQLYPCVMKGLKMYKDKPVTEGKSIIGTLVVNKQKNVRNDELEYLSSSLL